MTSDDPAFAPLLDGYRRFRNGDWVEERARWAELAQGQRPRALVIACSDSRVDPSRIFDAAPGEIFVVRNIANLVPPLDLTEGYHGVSAALEFAITQLEVAEVIVMGHGSCGGVQASLGRTFRGAPPGEGGFIARWMSLLDDARDRVIAEYGTGPDAAHALELESVRVSIANMRSFPSVPEREAAGTLKLRGAYFAIADGVLHLLNEATGNFEPALESNA